MTLPQRSADLRGQVVVFRADASLEIGSGHVMRCLTLADALRQEGAECHFICREHVGNLCEFIKARGFRTHCLPALNGASRLSPRENAGIDHDANLPPHAPWLGGSWQEDAATCGAILTDIAPDWLIVDHYALDSRWEDAVLGQFASQVPRVLIVDDLADRKHRADLVLDQGLGRRVEEYAPLVPRRCRVLAGPKFALLRPEFAHWREASLARRADNPAFKSLLINLGGVDKDNITGRVLESLKGCALPQDAKITVVMGAVAPWLEEVTAKAKELPWATEVAVNVSDMAQRMVEADIAIGAAGSTSWERCCLGLPTLMLVLADNQRTIALQLEQSGASATLDYETLEASLSKQLSKFAAPACMNYMSECAARLVDGAGVRRTLGEMRRVAGGVV